VKRVYEKLPPSTRLVFALKKYKVDSTLYHRILGYFSGIPDCCIEFFVLMLEVSHHNDLEFCKDYEKLERRADKKLKFKPAYRRCPHCITTGFAVEIDCHYTWTPKLRRKPNG